MMPHFTKYNACAKTFFGECTMHFVRLTITFNKKKLIALVQLVFFP